MSPRVITVLSLLLAGSLSIWGYWLLVSGVQAGGSAALAQAQSPSGPVAQYATNLNAGMNLASAPLPVTPSSAPLAPPPAPGLTPTQQPIPVKPVYHAPEYDQTIGPHKFPRDVRSGSF